MELLGDVGRGVNQAFEQVTRATQGVSTGKFVVNQHNVLAAAKIIQTQADELEDQLNDTRRVLRVEAPGTDDVSVRIAPAWNDRLVDDDDSYTNRVRQYVNSLHKLVTQLRDTAMAYGYTDEQVAAAFGGRQSA